MKSSSPCNTWHSKAVALTGTIGSGKSTVSSMFQKLGAATLSADELAHRAVEKGSQGLVQIATAFGNAVLLADGSLNRSRLAEIVFSDPEKRKILEGITHPIVRALAAESAEALLRLQPPLLIYDCPLLFEAGLEREAFQKIIVVASTPQLCLERVVRRDKISAEDAQRRLDAQYPIEDKRKRADIVIENSGTLDELDQQVRKVFRELTSADPATIQ